MRVPVVNLPGELSKSLLRGHPWVYADRLPQRLDSPTGTWVQVRCGRFLGYGLYDVSSPIAVRVFARDGVPDANWVAQRVQAAWDIREPLRAEGTTAYRWVYGEGDGLPGVVVDLYNDYAVIETYADSLSVLFDWLVPALVQCTRLKGVLFRRTGDRVRCLWGREPVRDLIVVENGLRLAANLVAGQKTGLFLDQRENRAFVERWCAGKTVLDCFAYTGAFSLYAVRGGAETVTSVDIAPSAVDGIRRNLALNGFDPDGHPSIVADCFELLREYASSDKRFDLVILDPPSLARSKKALHAALRAYARLNELAARCVAPGGLLATASCTSRVSPDAFRSMLGDAAAKARKRFLILHEAGHAIDHPVPAQFVEGRYLKFVLGRVMEVV